MQITVRREPTSLVGSKRSVGSESPAVKVYNLSEEQVVVGMAAVKPQVFIVLPSLKTEVCSYGARKFNELLKGKDIFAYLVTTDDFLVCSTFMQKNSISDVIITVDKDRDFGKKYGVLIEDGHLKDKLARAVFIVDTEGFIKYTQIVSEVTDEADYDSALAAIDEVCRTLKKGSHHHEKWMGA